MSEIRKNYFLKELRRNREYMAFVHSAMLNSRFPWIVAALATVCSIAEYRTGGAFSAFMAAALLYLLNYLAVLYTAEPVFAMKGRVLLKIVREEYVEYTVANSRIVKRVTSTNTQYEPGEEVCLFRFRPCFFIGDERTGMASASGCAGSLQRTAA